MRWIACLRVSWSSLCRTLFEVTDKANGERTVAFGALLLKQTVRIVQPRVRVPAGGSTVIIEVD